MEYYDYVDVKFDMVPVPDKKGAMELKSTVERNDIEQYFLKYPKAKQRALESDTYKNYTETDTGIALAMGMERHLKARRLLFKIMEERIESWWD